MLWFHTVFFTFWEHLTLPFFSLILVLGKDSSQHLSYGSQLYLSSDSLSNLISLSYQVILTPATLFLWLFTSVVYTSVSQRTCLITLCWRFKTIALYLVSEQFGFVFCFFFFPFSQWIGQQWIGFRSVLFRCPVALFSLVFQDIFCEFQFVSLFSPYLTFD